MGGRFVGVDDIDALITAFPIDETEIAATASGPIIPSQQVLAIVRDHGINRLKWLHWGLVPFWAKDTSTGLRLINARAETVATAPSFRNAFLGRRCLIPAKGFYEWPAEKGRKRPVFFTLPDSRPFAFAGLWELWNDHGKAAAAYLSCTIITTVAGRSVKPVHRRMPVILDPDAYDRWLDADNRDVRALEAILKTATIDQLILRPVSLRVGEAGSGAPDDIRPPTQMDLDFK